jgi:NTE family protein
VFVEALIEMGRADARRWLRRNPGVWASDGEGAGLEAPAPIAETTALDEYRALRRR